MDYGQGFSTQYLGIYYPLELPVRVHLHAPHVELRHARIVGVG